MRRYEAEQEGEEYHFTDDQNFDAVSDDELLEEGGSIASKLKQFILPAVIALLFIGYAGHKLMTLFSDPAPATKSSRNLVAATEFQSDRASVNNSAQSSATQTTLATQPSFGQPTSRPTHVNAINTPTVMSDSTALRANEIDNLLNESRESLDRVQEQLVKHIDRRVTTLAKENLKQEEGLAIIIKATGELNTNIAALSKSVQQTATEMQKQTVMQQRVIQHLQSEQLAQQNTPAIPADFSHHKAKRSNTHSHGRHVTAAGYYIQAIIPGRAWIKSTDGTIVTIVQGNVIPGYGRVLRVDSERGNVVTSSGRIIRFGIEQG